MRKLLSVALLMLSIRGVMAQQYNNEWIDFSKNYYKFKIAETALFRISQATLSGYGLGTTPAQDFKMYRNGKEVPIYTSVPSGILPVNGYIQFLGEPNDGKEDKVLYREPEYQQTDKWSLHSDTAVYFLTTSTGPNLRMLDASNDVAGNTLPVEPYFMYTAGNYFRSKWNLGFAAVVGEYVYSSDRKSVV